jgi:hypothetical protein
MTEPIACTLQPGVLREQRDSLLPGLTGRAVECQRTADGYRLTVAASAEILQAIAKVIEAERQCCRWLHFTLSVSPSGGPFVLTLSGPPGAVEFLEAILEAV